jgi:hypothetical protein
MLQFQCMIWFNSCPEVEFVEGKENAIFVTFDKWYPTHLIPPLVYPGPFVRSLDPTSGISRSLFLSGHLILSLAYSGACVCLVIWSHLLYTLFVCQATWSHPWYIKESVFVWSPYHTSGISRGLCLSGHPILPLAYPGPSVCLNLYFHSI